MKKFILSIVFVFVLCSCTKIPAGHFLGVWNVDSVIAEYDNGNTTKAGVNFYTITFKRGGVGYTGELPFTYKRDADSIKMEFKNGNVWACTIELTTNNSMNLRARPSDARGYVLVFSLSRVE